MANQSFEQSPESQALYDAVTKNQPRTALNLLVAAGDACKASDLAEAASKIHTAYPSLTITLGLDRTNNKEMLTVNRSVDSFAGSTEPIATVINAPCDRSTQKK